MVYRPSWRFSREVILLILGLDRFFLGRFVVSAASICTFFPCIFVLIVCWTSDSLGRYSFNSAGRVASAAADPLDLESALDPTAVLDLSVDLALLANY